MSDILNVYKSDPSLQDLSNFALLIENAPVRGVYAKNFVILYSVRKKINCAINQCFNWEIKELSLGNFRWNFSH